MAPSTWSNQRKQSFFRFCKPWLSCNSSLQLLWNFPNSPHCNYSELQTFACESVKNFCRVDFAVRLNALQNVDFGISASALPCVSVTATAIAPATGRANAPYAEQWGVRAGQLHSKLAMPNSTPETWRSNSSRFALLNSLALYVLSATLWALSLWGGRQRWTSFHCYCA